MIHKPTDEMSLRHLFSTNYSSSILRIEYWGPVLNHLGQIEPSPDCNVLDKRTEPFSIKKCEFKFIPRGIVDFEDNGNFDIAIVWDLPNNLNHNDLLQQLRVQNHCLELIILNDLRAFRRLPDYNIPEHVNLFLVQRLREFLIVREPDVIYSAYLIAKAIPHNINSERLINLLVNTFPRIRNMQARGRGNVIARFIQMQPALLRHAYGNNYYWNNDFEPNACINMMERLFQENFRMEIPQDDLNEQIR